MIGIRRGIYRISGGEWQLGTLITPYGGELVNLVDESEALADKARRLPSLHISDRAMFDLELLATGGFSPLDRFMSKADLESVIGDRRLADGTLWPMPITLPVDDAPRLDSEVALRDARNNLLGVMRVEEAYEWDRDAMAAGVFGTRDEAHPLVAEMRGWGRHNISGELRALGLPKYPDFAELRLTPARTRAALEGRGAANVVAFQTRNPLHRAHEELTKRAMERLDATLLLHPVVGLTRPGDVDHYTRVRTYKALVENHYDGARALLALLPLAMRLAGPREALWHALIRRNFGANHIIIGRDHASPGVDSRGKPFYDPFEAQEVVQGAAGETGVGAATFSEMVYVPSEKRYMETTELAAGVETLSISGTQARRDYLNAGRRLPEWFTRAEVADILGEAYPPRFRQGVCLWFTGLSGAGKTTTVDALASALMEHGRRVSVLDGDVVRTNLSKGLGFSKEDRDANVLRIAFVASEIARHGGVALCAAISPYRETRERIRRMFPRDQFAEVFVDTPLSVCESRDVKGMYAKARAGEITGFTGIDDPYEEPLDAEIALDTVANDVGANVGALVGYLKAEGFLR